MQLVYRGAHYFSQSVKTSQVNHLQLIYRGVHYSRSKSSSEQNSPMVNHTLIYRGTSYQCSR